MKRLIGFLILLLIVQGCSTYVPNEQEASIPERLSAPSALVLMNQQATVLGVDGSMIKITKMGNGKFTNFLKQGDKTFFIHSDPSRNSLWQWDKEKSTLACLIPNIQPRSTSTQWIESYEVSTDKQFCLFKYWLQKTLNDQLLYTFSLYSILRQKAVPFPISSEEIVSDAWFEQGETTRFYFITRSKETKENGKKNVYWWNTTTNESKKLFSFESERYVGSSFTRYLVVQEKKNLVRYSLDAGTKEILKENLIEASFNYIGTTPYLFFCEYGTNSTPLCSYMTPQKDWRVFSFYAFDDIASFQIADQNHVAFLTQNQLTNIRSFYLWNTQTNKTTLLYQSKTIKKEFSLIMHPFTQDKYLAIKSEDEEKGNVIILHNLKEGTTKTIDNNAENGLPLSNDASKWYIWSQKEQSAKVQLPYMYNFKDGKEYPIVINNTEMFIPEGATNDGKYMVIRTIGKNPKTIVIEIPECKEIPLPEVKNFQFITWLE